MARGDEERRRGRTAPSPNRDRRARPDGRGAQRRVPRPDAATTSSSRRIVVAVTAGPWPVVTVWAPTCLAVLIGTVSAAAQELPIPGPEPSVAQASVVAPSEPDR